MNGLCERNSRMKSGNEMKSLQEPFSYLSDSQFIEKKLEFRIHTNWWSEFTNLELTLRKNLEENLRIFKRKRSLFSNSLHKSTDSNWQWHRSARMKRVNEITVYKNLFPTYQFIENDRLDPILSFSINWESDRLEKERIRAQIHYNLNFDAKYAFNLQMKKERHISFEFCQRRG